MEVFPINTLVFSEAKLSGTDGDASLEISIVSFNLQLGDYSEPVDTVVRLDSINIPVNLRLLENREFTFPTNPQKGYIDGSVYFFAAHNPVDVTEIKFGVIAAGKIPLTIESLWVLEYENSGFRNLTKRIETYIKL